MAKKSQSKPSASAQGGTKVKNSVKSVSSKWTRAVRKDRTNIDDKLQSLEYRETIIYKTNHASPEASRLRMKFISDKEQADKIDELMHKYASNVTDKKKYANLKSKIVHAVKTNKVAEQCSKWVI